MKKTWLLLTILILLVTAALFQQNYQMQEVEKEAQTIGKNMSFPKGIPGNSAPPATLTACAGKQLDDECELGESKGICFMSGDRLACGPVIADETNSDQ